MRRLVKRLWWLATTPKAARCMDEDLCGMGLQCSDKRQCFDPCGDLGHDEEHALVAWEYEQLHRTRWAGTPGPATHKQENS